MASKDFERKNLKKNSRISKIFGRIHLQVPPITSRKNCGPQAAQKLFRPLRKFEHHQGGKILIFFDEIRHETFSVASDNLLKKLRPSGCTKTFQALGKIENLKIHKGGKIMIFFHEIRHDPSMVASNSLQKKLRPSGCTKTFQALGKIENLKIHQGGKILIFFHEIRHDSSMVASNSLQKKIAALRLHKNFLGPQKL